MTTAIEFLLVALLSFALGFKLASRSWAAYVDDLLSGYELDNQKVDMDSQLAEVKGSAD